MLVFYAVVAALFVVAIIAAEVESFGWSTVALIVSVVAGHWILGMNALAWVSTHGTETFLYVLAYLVAGVVWSFLKWLSYCFKYRDAYREAQRQATINNHNLRLYTPREFYPNHYGEPLLASNNKKRIVFWMSLFPVSVIGTLLNDPVRRLFKFLFERLSASYQYIADAVVGDVNK